MQTQTTAGLSDHGFRIADMSDSQLLPKTHACAAGHYTRTSTVIRIARIVEASPQNHTVEFRSLSVGDRKLAVERCSKCSQIETYMLSARDGSGSKSIGTDPEVISAALGSLLDDANDRSLTLAVRADVNRSLVIPSHHLPVFIVEDGR